MNIVLSSGHSFYVRGASGVLDEVNEARRVVDQVAIELQRRGVIVMTFHDNISRTQSDNLNAIVNYHNSLTRDLDVSVHFNAHVETESPMGVEVLYVTQQSLAAEVSASIASCGFKDRGAKYRDDLRFLNSTSAPAILIEVCFVDSEADAKVYWGNYSLICKAIASALVGEEVMDGMTKLRGRVSWFGGPNDEGVAPDEGLAFIFSVEDAPHLFLPRQPPGTSGLARRLDPEVYYIATRWDYSKHPKETLVNLPVLVRAPATSREFMAFPADWGPNENTGRVADISKGLLDALGISTDDEVEVLFPYEVES